MVLCTQMPEYLAESREKPKTQGQQQMLKLSEQDAARHRQVAIKPCAAKK